MRISTPDRARIAGLLGELCLAIDAIPDPDPAPVPKRTTQLSGLRVCAMTGLSMADLKAIAVMTDEAFESYLHDRNPLVEQPELPLGPPASLPPASSITPSKSDVGVARFAQSVRDLTEPEQSVPKAAGFSLEAAE